MDYNITIPDGAIDDPEVKKAVEVLEKLHLAKMAADGAKLDEWLEEIKGRLSQNEKGMLYRLLKANNVLNFPNMKNDAAEKEMDSLIEAKVRKVVKNIKFEEDRRKAESAVETTLVGDGKNTTMFEL